MPASNDIDKSKSLAELTGVDWGVVPDGAGSLVRERHEIRRTPIGDLPDAAIVRFLDMGTDADILVPVALNRLRGNPDAVDLLCAVLRAEHFDWRRHAELVAEVRERVYAVINEIEQITNDLERLQHGAAVWKFYAEFERGLSTI
jgi:hypothetical protein